MPPLITREKLNLLNKEFYGNNNIMGRDRLFNLLRKNYGEEAPSRRQIASWLKRDDIKELIKPVILKNIIYYEALLYNNNKILISRDYLLNNKTEMIRNFETNNNLKFYINTNTKTGKKTTRFYFNY
jgi:hypothetical protein